MINGVLSVLYWYSRENASGISLHAIWTLVFSSLMKSLNSAIRVNNQTQLNLDTNNVVLASVTALWGLVPALLAVWLIFPFTVQARNGHWAARRRKLSHRERSDWRYEKSLSEATRALVGGFYFVITVPASGDRFSFAKHFVGT